MFYLCKWKILIHQQSNFNGNVVGDWQKDFIFASPMKAVQLRNVF